MQGEEGGGERKGNKEGGMKMGLRKRGGPRCLVPLAFPEPYSTSSPLTAMKHCLQLTGHLCCIFPVSLDSQVPRSVSIVSQSQRSFNLPVYLPFSSLSVLSYISNLLCGIDFLLLEVHLLRFLWGQSSVPERR